MDLMQQANEIMEKIKEKAAADGQFRELVRTDFDEAFRQVSGFNVSFSSIQAKLEQAKSDSDELSPEDLDAVAGGVDSAGLHGFADVGGSSIADMMAKVSSGGTGGGTGGEVLVNQGRAGSGGHGSTEMQDMMDKQNEMFNMLNDVMKNMNDMRKKIINNIG